MITLVACEGFKSNKGEASYSRVDLLAGYRYLRLNDQLSIADSFGSLDPDAPVEFRITDSFQTANEFQGADLAMQWQGGWKRWTMDGLVRTGLGNVREEVTIAGNTVITSNGINPVVYANGLLAQPTNAGTYSRDQFSVIPELGRRWVFRFCHTSRHAGNHLSVLGTGGPAWRSDRHGRQRGPAGAADHADSRGCSARL